MREPQGINSIWRVETYEIYTFYTEFEAIRYAIVDMNNDDENELLLECVDRANRSNVEYIILHEYNGSVYGDMIVFRGFQNLQKNGLVMKA